MQSLPVPLRVMLLRPSLRLPNLVKVRSLGYCAAKLSPLNGEQRKASVAGTADRRGPHVDWGLRFLRAAKAVNRPSTFGNRFVEGSRLKRDL
jgi:hypothetical protein